MAVPTSKVQSPRQDPHQPLLYKIKSRTKSLFYPSSSSSSSMAPPQSRPTHPSSTRLVYIGDPDRTHHESVPAPAGNSISTTKYNVLTFIPRNLYEQFRRVAYVYFFLLACLNQVPQLNMVGGATAFVPLGTVLVLTALKDGYEDYQRHKSDKDQNNRFASVLDPHSRTFITKKWRDIRVGEIVKLGKDETLPCDLVLLSCSDPSGAAYIQTLNLDGESNLKTRYALHQFAARTPESWLAAAAEAQARPGLIKCEAPNLNIHGFQASIVIDEDGREISLGPNNVVLRGCEIKNTEWVFGVVVYAGMETKVMLNSSGAPSKRSRLETQMNREMIVLAVGMVVMCSVIATLTGIWLKHKQDVLDIMPYYRRKDYSSGTPKNYKYDGIGLEVLFAFVKSVFMFQNFIPISLYISMECARLTQTVLMSRDRSMYHEATDSKLQCRALNINEDLGQIKYIFSDKTGTLTENKMVFQCASVCGVDYSQGQGPIPGEVAPHPTLVDGQVWRPKVAVNTDPRLVRLLENGEGTEEGNLAHNFFLALSLCNTIVPQVAETSDPTVKLIDYQGESPDEQALLYAAAAYGFVLIERTSGHIVVDVLGDRQRFEILGIHEFDSDRKRMSVIVSCPDMSTKLFVKGADNSMFIVMDKSTNGDIIHETEKHLHSYSSVGLRTLVIGMRELSSTDFEDWLLAYEKASTSLSGRNDLLKAVAVKVESDLHILGASGIEDKLQLGVPEAIESLRHAGIKVWVLTGDKQETAISIGYSCKLLADDMTQIIINSHSEESVKISLRDAIATTKTLVSTRNIDEGRKLHRVPLALIIDGPSLVHILKTDLEEELYEVAVICDAVLCCRVAPLQKAGIVSLIKNRTSDMTLSIGDGANDVSMIQMADVGIGISGQEGRQAVMASDFAMGQFRFLVPLLLVHGHWNYQRMSYMILYNIYRNAILVFLDYWFIYYSEFSLSNPVNEMSAILYSAVYTSLPNIFVGIYDQDLSRKTLLKYPEFYGVGPREESYSFRLFALTMMDSLWQSLVVFYAPYFAYVRSSLDDSSLGDIWMFSVVLLVNLHLAMDVIRWNLKLHAVIWGTTVITFLSILGLDQTPGMTGYRAFNHLISTGVFWLTLLSIVAIALLPRFICKLFNEYLFPDDVRIGREMEKLEKDYVVAEDETDSSTNSHRR